MNEDIDILLARYFSGEATAKELRELDVWLAQSQENEDYFDRMTRLYQESASVSPAPAFDAEAALPQFQDYMQKNQEKLSASILKMRRIYGAAVAAVAAVLLLGISLFFILRNPAEPMQILATENETVERQIFENIDIALAPNSQIAYASKRENSVTLSGKATFSVQEKGEKELIVSVGEAFIKDIGTVFTVTAYDAGAPIVVEVAEGEVLFYTETQAGITIKQHESGQYNPADKKFTHYRETKIADDILFHATPLREAADELQKRYGVRIEIASETLQTARISASFDPNEPIENILQVIAETVSAKTSKKGDVFVISQ